jgi:two-component system phosphate regulon sensor histidine kinase PhoR
VIESVIENIKLKYEDVEIEILNKLEKVKIEADEFHFTNIVYNLIDNAVKYCDEKPKIAILIAKENQNLKVVFIDNGIGISNKNIDFIFDKFYRIPSKKINEVNGFGLGLYYVKKICLQHKWKISANNNNQGLTIQIDSIKIV